MDVRQALVQVSESRAHLARTETFRGYRAAGVNRLSVGIQSFNPAHLKALGRIHDERQARRAVEIARSHFENFNLDLMYGLPTQSVHEARAEVYQRRRDQETSLMAKGIFGYAANESRGRTGQT